MKDKDVPAEVEGADSGSTGYCGSDVLDEFEDDLREKFQARAVRRIGNLRYTVAARPDKLANVTAKLDHSEPICLGTSYPRAMKKILGARAVPAIFRQGCVEGLPWRFEKLDGIFELVDSGISLKENGLIIVQDDFARINLIELTTTAGQKPVDMEERN